MTHPHPRLVAAMVVAPVVQRVPAPVKLWGAALARRHLYVLVHHPHHYVTAFLLTGFLFVTGHWELGAVEASWAYAMLENLATAAEVLNDTVASA